MTNTEAKPASMPVPDGSESARIAGLSDEPRKPNYDWDPNPGPCPFATMDWYCVLRDGHEGPHRSEDLG